MIVNAPILSKKTIESYTERLDQMISAELPHDDSEVTLFEIVKMTSYTGILRHARNTEMESVGLILVDFLQK